MKTLGMKSAIGTGAEPRKYPSTRMTIPRVPTDMAQALSPGQVDAVTSTSLAGRDPAHPQLLTNIVSLDRAETPTVESHTNVQPVFDVYANVQGTNLGRVSDQVTKIVNEIRPKLGAGNTITVRGQVESMNTAFSKLGLGLNPTDALRDGTEVNIQTQPPKKSDHPDKTTKG